jgi:hypothetical protein
MIATKQKKNGKVSKIVNKLSGGYMKMNSYKKQPRKSSVRFTVWEFERDLKAARKRNFEMKKWIRSYYDQMETDRQ